MKSYEIIDESLQLSIGVLLYYEKSGAAVIELEEQVDEWTAPLLLADYIRRKIYTIPTEISRLFIEERIVPSGRQNIGTILRKYHMKEYEAIKLLEISEGRCSQDSLAIRKIEMLPDYVIKRQQHNVCEAEVIAPDTLLAIFRDETVRRISLKSLEDTVGMDKVLGNPQLRDCMSLVPGGYGIAFDRSAEIPAEVLYNRGILMPITAEELYSFAQKNLRDTSECCASLACSRQNLAYYTKNKSLKAVKAEVKGNLYRRGEAESLRW